MKYDPQALGNIPAELVNLPRWVVWKLLPNNEPGKPPKKFPFDPKNGRTAKPGQPETWGTFAQALEALQAGDYTGLGFELAGDGIVGIDLDHVIDPATGQMGEEARQIVDRLDSYTEISPSGTGVHILVKGHIPKDGKRNIPKGFEVYQNKRYLTVTGKPWGPLRPLQPRQEALDWFYSAYFPDSGNPDPPRGSKPTVPARAPSPDYLSVGLERDPAFSALWNGQRPTGDESSDDLALMNKLAYWCNRDEAAMVSAFLSSPYAAQKGRQHTKKMGRKDYLPRTARKAAQGCTETAADHDREFQERHFPAQASGKRPAASTTAPDNKPAKRPISLEVVKEALDAFRITVRHNQITNEMEISGLPPSYSQENAAAVLPVFLMDRLRAAHVTGCTIPVLEGYLFLVADEHRYNPVRELLENQDWDGVDRFPILYEILGIADPAYHTFIRKWFIQCAAMACNSEKQPFGADGVLVLQGPQGIGKTRFFQVVAMRPDWFVDGATIDMDNKDSLIKSVSRWICELGELDNTVKKEQAALKAHITSPVDIIRAPYARAATKRIRRTSYCGTVNPRDYLRDETGSRRFWTVPVEHIDLDRLHALSETWLRQLWAQAHRLFVEAPNGFRLTGEERRWLEGNNQQFARPLPGEQEIRDLLDPDLAPSLWGWFKPSHIAQRVQGYKPTAFQVGVVLKKLAQEIPGIEIKRTKAGMAYRLPIHPYHSF